MGARGKTGGTRIHVADSIKKLSADLGPWLGPLLKDLEGRKTQDLKRRRSFANQNGRSGVNSPSFSVHLEHESWRRGQKTP